MEFQKSKDITKALRIGIDRHITKHVSIRSLSYGDYIWYGNDIYFFRRRSNHVQRVTMYKTDENGFIIKDTKATVISAVKLHKIISPI